MTSRALVFWDVYAGKVLLSLTQREVPPAPSTFGAATFPATLWKVQIKILAIDISNLSEIFMQIGFFS